MTDKQLDEKIRSAFDNVRAGDSVKARIKKGITGDDMDNRNITAADNITKSEITATNGKAAVKRSGRITAAAVAAVVAVGGGAYLLKGGFDRVDDKPQSKTESKPESADSYVGSAPADFDGFFDPQGYTLYDKFGKNSDIWRLNSGNFLVRQVNGEGAEYYQFDGQEFCYFLYDGSENAVTKEVKTDGAGVYVYDDCFVTWKTNYGEQDEYGVTVNTTMTCTIYDTDLEVVRDNIELKLDHEDPMGAPIVGADNKLFYAGMSYDGEKNTINVYRENGEKISDYNSSGLFSTTTAAVSGNYMYFLCAEEDGLKPQVQALNDGYLNLSLFLSKEEAQNCLLYSAGDTVYMAYPDENGKLTVDANPVTGSESTVTSYEATFPLNVRNSNDCYVTKDGKFLFVAAPMTDNTGVDIYVYDLEDTSAEAKVFSFEGLSADTFADGRNVLFDEASGDVCIGGFTAAETLPSARQDTVLTFNLYTDEYTNFGIKQTDGGYDDGYDGGEEQSETSESELNYIDDSSNINAVNAKTIFNMVETAFNHQYSVGSVGDASLSFNSDELAEAVKNGFDESTVKGRLMKELYAECEPTEIDILNTEFEVIVELEGNEGYYVAVVIYEDDTHTGYYSYPANALEKLESIKSSSIKMQTVPDVTGLESEKAQETLLKANFNVVLRNTWDDNVPENRAVMTDPEAGTEFHEGGNVTLYISKGSLGEDVKVPNVVGLTLEKAVTILKDHKLTVSVKEIPRDGDKGMVIDQSIEPDKKVDKGTEVTIYVSTGEKTDVSLTIQLPLPEGLHGAYTVDVYKDGNVAYTQSIANGEAVAGSEISLDIIGKKSETLTVFIKSEESGKSVDYAVFDVDYDKKTAELNGSLNKDGLLAITPAFASESDTAEVPLTIKLPLPEGLHGAYTVDVYKDGNVAYTQSIANGEAVAGSEISLDIIGKKSETLTVSIKNEESGKSVDYAVFNVDYDKKTADLNGRLNKDGLLAITPAK
ncbi:PASTA domain-containing protein [Ruminococcus sp.]|uniref:PASTA domain-containing protein n=1 Tax=Ruminococcus sp. TaxID=41978 RepID=UPI0025D82CE0|nr:PASTA domain-containing protein [Ruminococcus sp.]